MIPFALQYTSELIIGYGIKHDVFIRFTKDGLSCELIIRRCNIVSIILFGLQSFLEVSRNSVECRTDFRLISIHFCFIYNTIS
ncbi:hypothetical protein D3C73_993600 [compost metagenome]